MSRKSISLIVGSFLAAAAFGSSAFAGDEQEAGYVQQSIHISGVDSTTASAHKIVGTGTRGNKIVGTGVRPTKIVGTGVRPTKIVGTGVRPTKIVGTGVRRAKIVGTGVRP